MIRHQRLETIRHRIGQQLCRAQRQPAWPAVSFGAAAIDSAFPEEGLATGALHELFPACHGDLAAALGFSLGLLTRIARIRSGFVLYCVPDDPSCLEGRIDPLGLLTLGFDPDRLILLRVRKTRDVLWALEQGLENSELAAVLGILPGNDQVYDFTASRRLSLRAARSGATGLLLRHFAKGGNATAARTRWSVATEASAGIPCKGAVLPRLGPPRWVIRLVKSKKGPLRHWLVEWDHETLSFRLAAPLADRAAPVVAHLATEQTGLAA